MTAKVLFIPFGDGGGGPSAPCIPTVQRIGAGAPIYGGEVTVPLGASAAQNGLIFGGIFGNFRNTWKDNDDQTAIPLIGVQSVEGSPVWAVLKYRHDRAVNTGTPDTVRTFPRLVLEVDSEFVMEVPAPVGPEIVLIAAVCEPPEPGEKRTYSIVVGDSVYSQVRPSTSQGWPSTDQMEVYLGRGDGDDADVPFACGGGFIQVPAVPSGINTAAVAVTALGQVARSARLSDYNPAGGDALVWSAQNMNPPQDPWPETDGGPGLPKIGGADSQYLLQCLPAWSPIQTPYAQVQDGANLGGGAGVFKKEINHFLTFRSLISSDASIGITEGADEVDLKVAGTPSPTTLQQAYIASGAADPQIQLSDANGPVKIDTDGTGLQAALELQKAIQYGDDFNTSPNFRIFTVDGGFVGKNVGVSIEAQDNTGDDPAAAGGDIINKAGSNTSGGDGIGGNVINQAGTGGTNDGTVDSKVGSTLGFQTQIAQNVSFFDLLLSNVAAATRKLIYTASGGAWGYDVDAQVADAEPHNVSWPGKPTRDAGNKFQVGDIITVRQDDTDNAVTEWAPFGQVRTAKASYADNHYTNWTGTNWVLPKDNADPEVVPNQLKVELTPAKDFTQDGGGGNGGRITYTGLADKTVRVVINFTVIRPPAVSLDARGQFYIGVKPGALPDFAALPGSQQWKRLNIIDCDDVITVQSLVEVAEGDVIALMGTSDAGGATDGLGIEIKGYSLVVTEV